LLITYTNVFDTIHIHEEGRRVRKEGNGKTAEGRGVGR
jgi:hypothetical protein